jgi:hypothetical protein
MSARDFLEAELTEAEIALEEADAAVEAASSDREIANERVIAIETALADLARLEGPLFSPIPGGVLGAIERGSSPGARIVVDGTPPDYFTPSPTDTHQEKP